MANLKQGMSGNEVRDLQQKLIDAGYGDLLGNGQDDGIFGAKTAQAVKAYQKDNGLVVDGIAGKNTLGALNSAGSNNTNTGGNTGGNTNTNTNNNNAGSNKIVDGGTKEPAAGTPKVDEVKTVTSPAGFTYGDFSYADFDPMADEQIKQAWDILTQHNASNPGEFTDPNGYKDAYMGYLNQYENRDPFSYDFNSDALYQQYKDQYIQQGQLAMMDTMGQAAAMTGGYGNSYAQTVGQQAYNQQLSQLNEIMPELYGMAYDRYNQEGQDMLNMYNTYLGLYQNDYGMHQDTLDRWYQENARLQGNYDTLYGQGYDNYLLGYNTALNEYNTDRSEEFSKWQTEQDQTFTASENQKSREFTATENEKDREVKATTGSSSKETKYTVLDYEEQTKWEKSFDKAESISDVDRIADKMEQAGVDPQVVASWHDYYAEKFKNDKTPIVVEPIYSPLSTTNINVRPSANSRGGAGGSGGISYWEQR